MNPLARFLLRHCGHHIHNDVHVHNDIRVVDEHCDGYRRITVDTGDGGHMCGTWPEQ